MAWIGLRYMVVAELDSHTDGSEPTYKAGMELGKAISANLTINRNSNPLRANDGIAEDDNSITGMSIELGVDDVSEEVQAYMGLVDSKTTGTGNDAMTVYYDTTAPAKDVGTGYIRVRRKNGVDSYQATWNYSAMFGFSNENAQTKGESIEWQTPTLTGRYRDLYVDDSGKTKFRKRANFETYEAAKAWLDTLAGIT